MAERTSAGIFPRIMNRLELFADNYSEFEERVGRLMNRLCSETCGMCTACCCRADICEEVGQSAFLSLLLRRQGLRPDDMDDRYGWLDLAGCSLNIGRPPICYAYFCDQLLDRFPDEETRQVTRILGQLLDYTGVQALNGWHLVEIKDTDDLANVDYEALSGRLEQAQAAFNVIEHYVETCRLTPGDRDILERIPLQEL